MSKDLQFKVNHDEEIISVPFDTTKEEVMKVSELKHYYENKGYSIQYKLDI